MGLVKRNKNNMINLISQLAVLTLSGLFIIFGTVIESLMISLILYFLSVELILLTHDFKMK